METSWAKVFKDGSIFKDVNFAFATEIYMDTLRATLEDWGFLKRSSILLLNRILDNDHKRTLYATIRLIFEQ